MNPIGYEGIAKAKVGEKYRYIAGRGDHHIEANVTVEKDGQPGNTGLWVVVDEIHTAGSACERQVDERIIAGANELFPLQEN